MARAEKLPKPRALPSVPGGREQAFRVRERVSVPGDRGLSAAPAMGRANGPQAVAVNRAVGVQVLPEEAVRVAAVVPVEEGAAGEGMKVSHIYIGAMIHYEKKWDS